MNMKKILSLATAIVAASALTSGAQWYVNGFDNLALPGGAGFIPNSSPLLTYSGLGITYGVSGSSGDVFSFQYPPPGGTDVAVGTVQPTDSLKVQMLGGPVVAIKGDFWLSDSVGAPTAGTLGATVKLSDNSTVPFVFGSPYYAPSGLTISEFSLYQVSQSTDAFPSMDNFAVAVPEPGVIVTNIMVVLGALGGAWAYRRRKC